MAKECVWSRVQLKKERSNCEYVFFPLSKWPKNGATWHMPVKAFWWTDGTPEIQGVSVRMSEGVTWQRVRASQRELFAPIPGLRVVRGFPVWETEGLCVYIWWHKLDARQVLGTEVGILPLSPKPCKVRKRGQQHDQKCPWTSLPDCWEESQWGTGWVKGSVTQAHVIPLLQILRAPTSCAIVKIKYIDLLERCISIHNPQEMLNTCSLLSGLFMYVLGRALQTHEMQRVSCRVVCCLKPHLCKNKIKQKYVCNCICKNISWAVCQGDAWVFVLIAALLEKTRYEINLYVHQQLVG